MNDRLLTVWEQAQLRGYSRRDFMRFCTWIAAGAGIHSSGLPQVVKALETKPRPPVVWFHFQECTCCTESFLRSPQPLFADIIMDMISLDYTETLQAAAGRQAEAALHDTMDKYRGEYLMMAEGAIPLRDNGVYCCIGGRTALDMLTEAAAGAKAIIAWGSCASNGCIQAASPNPTGAVPISQVVTGKPIINVPGCPPNAKIMAGTMVHLLAFDRIPQLDRLGRPRAYYSHTVHDDCSRLPHYEAGRFVESFDDQNARLGYCLYHLGCRGPETYNGCGVLRWNGGTGSDISSGHGCIGCSEAGFWDKGPLYQQTASLSGSGIRTAVGVAGIVVGVGAAIGIAGHVAFRSAQRRRVDRAARAGSGRTADMEKGE